jgi:hypothetical protein
MDGEFSGQVLIVTGRGVGMGVRWLQKLDGLNAASHRAKQDFRNDGDSHWPHDSRD